MTRPRRPSPDDQLAPDNYWQLNRTFYAAKPADYFGQRLENLILTAGRSEDLDWLMTEGVTYRGLKVGGHVEGRNASTSASSAAHIRETSLLLIPLIPSERTRSSTRRVQTPARYASETTATSARSARRRGSSRLGK